VYVIIRSEEHTVSRSNYVAYILLCNFKNISNYLKQIIIQLVIDPKVCISLKYVKNMSSYITRIVFVI
jgi:hypothetical protein